MTSKNIFTILLAIATVLFLSLTLYFLNEKTRIENSKRLLSGQIATMSVKEFSFDLNNTMTGRKAIDVVCVTQNNEEKFLSELLNGRPILIYRYTQAGGCRPCYEAQIRLLQEIFNDFSQSAAILATYETRGGFLISARSNVSEIPILRVSSNAFNWQFEQIGIPYFFVLHPCMRISNIFVPNEHEPKLTRRYLESIKRLLQ